MKTIKCSLFLFIVVSGNIFAAEPMGSASANNGGAQPKAKVQSVPVIGSMLEDGREVPARFQGVETKEQKARRERQEQGRPDSEKE